MCSRHDVHESNLESNEFQSQHTTSLPPISNIPVLGTGNYDEYEDEYANRRGVYKSTDTPYIILSKQNGRADLLQFNENKKDREISTKSYPRCDWYYLEDNAMLDKMKAQEKEQHAWVSQVPDYITHQAFNANTKKPKVKEADPWPYHRDLPAPKLAQKSRKVSPCVVTQTTTNSTKIPGAHCKNFITKGLDPHVTENKNYHVTCDFFPERFCENLSFKQQKWMQHSQQHLQLEKLKA